MIVDISRARITTPDTIYPSVRFIWHNNRAAVWEIDRRIRTATRLALLDNTTFIKGPTARIPNRLILSDGTEWTITQKSGGCGCGYNPLGNYSIDDLLAEEPVSVG